MWLVGCNYRAHVVRNHEVTRGGDRDLGDRVNWDAVRRHGAPAGRSQAASQAREESCGADPGEVGSVGVGDWAERLHERRDEQELRSVVPALRSSVRAILLVRTPLKSRRFAAVFCSKQRRKRGDHYPVESSLSHA